MGTDEHRITYSLRVDPELIKRFDRLLPVVQRVSLGDLRRSELVRHALLLGLQSLEERYHAG